MDRSKETRYHLQYAKDKLKRIPLDVKRDFYGRLCQAAQKQGESVNGYIKRAVTARMDAEDAGDAGQDGPAAKTDALEDAGKRKLERHRRT